MKKQSRQYIRGGKKSSLLFTIGWSDKEEYHMAQVENSIKAENLRVIPKMGFEVNELPSQDLIQQDTGTHA